MNSDLTHNSNGAGHEPNTIGLRAIVYSVIGLFVVVIATFVLMLGMWQLMAGTPELPTDAARDAGLANVHLDLPPTVPLLNPDQSVELAELRASEREMLREYGWVDPQHEAARIPIDRAIEMVSKNGLPSVIGPPAAAEGGSNE